MAQPAIIDIPPEVARIDDLAERARSACPTPSETSSSRSSGARVLLNKPRPGALRLLFEQDVASDWWLEAQLLFGELLYQMLELCTVTDDSLVCIFVLLFLTFCPSRAIFVSGCIQRYYSQGQRK